MAKCDDQDLGTLFCAAQAGWNRPFPALVTGFGCTSPERSSACAAWKKTLQPVSLRRDLTKQLNGASLEAFLRS